jgi:hypothetical protein
MRAIIFFSCIFVVALLPGFSWAGTVTQGKLASTAAGTDRGYDISGQATMVRQVAGNTHTALVVKGLKPNSDYHAHVHVLPCADGAGGHYKNDPNGPADETNEIHFDFTTNANGVGEAVTQSEFYARPEAQTIIVHDPDKTKIGCADLNVVGRDGK